jgi:hypothetical protein
VGCPDDKNAGTPPPATTNPGTLISKFEASPNNGYINAGSSATLSWQVQHCGTTCIVRLEGKDGLNYKDTIMMANVPLSGSLNVQPTRSTETKYTIRALGGGGSAQKSLVVQLFRAPDAPSGSVFYFKAINPLGSTQYVGLTCYTFALYAPNESVAKQMAQAQNIGLTVTGIGPNEFTIACPSSITP